VTAAEVADVVVEVVATPEGVAEVAVAVVEVVVMLHLKWRQLLPMLLTPLLLQHQEPQPTLLEQRQL
jgi:hypothetical protein